MSSTSKLFGVELGFKVEDKLLRWSGILAGEALLVFIIVWFVIIPRVNETLGLRDELGKQRALLTNLERKIGLIEEFNVEFAGRDEIMAATFMAQKDSGLALSNIKQIVDASGMNVVSFRIGSTSLVGGNERGGVGADPLEIEITVDGPSAAVGPFLRAIDESLPIKNVTELEVAQGSLQAGGNLELKMKINVYSLPSRVQPSALGLLQPFSDDQMELSTRLSTFSRPTSDTLVRPALGNPDLFAE